MINATDWANSNLNKIFINPPARSLDGQCVTLVKAYLEQCGINDPYQARGNAKDFGNTLVNQGLATVVSTANRLSGDIVVWPQDGGRYGHIGVLIDGDRIFEENVGLIGARSEVVTGGTLVYASRIDPLYANWRVGLPVFYRLVPKYKPVDAQVVLDVWNGKYGEGPARKENLRAAGYDPDEVQREVNKGDPRKVAPIPPAHELPEQKEVQDEYEQNAQEPIPEPLPVEEKPIDETKSEQQKNGDLVHAETEILKELPAKKSLLEVIFGFIVELIKKVLKR